MGKLTPYQNYKEWNIEHIIKKPISDIGICDIDGDGIDELATIEPFHGAKFRIYKKIDGEYKAIYECPNETEFLHVVWGGQIRGKKTFIGGARRKDAELFMVQYRDGEYETVILDKGRGPANISVVNGVNKDFIITANNSIHEACVYIVEDD